MQKDFEKKIKRYIKKIKHNMKLLPNGNKQLMSDIENDIFDFIENENVTDFEKVVQRFGSAKDVLSVFAGEEDAQLVLKKLRNRKILLAVLIPMLLCVFAFLLVLLASAFEPEGYYVVS